MTTDLSPEETFPIPVGGLNNSPNLDVRRGKWSVKASELQEVYEPVVKEILHLVNDQLLAVGNGAQDTVILLVGGFGTSNYLRGRIQDEVQHRPKVKVLQPPHAWQAVVMGAVLKGLGNINANSWTGQGWLKIVNRRARKHVGTELCVPYKEEEHSCLKQKPLWSDLDGTKMVKTMEWYIQRVRISRYTPRSMYMRN